MQMWISNDIGAGATRSWSLGERLILIPIVHSIGVPECFWIFSLRNKKGKRFQMIKLKHTEQELPWKLQDVFCLFALQSTQKNQKKNHRSPQRVEQQVERYHQLLKILAKSPGPGMSPKFCFYWNCSFLLREMWWDNFHMFFFCVWKFHKRWLVVAFIIRVSLTPFLVLLCAWKVQRWSGTWMPLHSWHDFHPDVRVYASQSEVTRADTHV